MIIASFLSSNREAVSRDRGSDVVGASWLQQPASQYRLRIDSHGFQLIRQLVGSFALVGGSLAGALGARALFGAGQEQLAAAVAPAQPFRLPAIELAGPALDAQADVRKESARPRHVT